MEKTSTTRVILLNKYLCNDIFFGECFVKMYILSLATIDFIDK